MDNAPLGMGLGRIVQHDPRSLSFPAQTTGAVRKITHRHFLPILDQGQTGSCTGNAAAQCLNTKPFKKGGRVFREPDALRFYGKATQLDGFPGTYPPDDTGSSGLAVAKALQQEGLIRAYNHAFGLDHVVGALMITPGITGTAWHESMFYPDADGFVHPDGNEVGGHEYLLFGVDPDKEVLTFLNSWSRLWGINGRFYMKFDDYDALLKSQGDVTFFQE